MKKLFTTLVAVLALFSTLSAQVKTGDAAADFSFSTPDGEKYTMASFAGKVVYIDVWATWCPPCRAEIPHMQKLEKSYEGKKVAFVSISIDKDKTAWDKWQKDKTMTGVQLYAPQEQVRSFAQSYGINTIPRFILVGKDGKVIDDNAPRPSDVKEITELIDKALK